MRAAGMGDTSRVGDWPGLENEDSARATRRRFRGRASDSRAAGARVLEDDDDDGAVRRLLGGIIALSLTVAEERRPRTSKP